MVFFWFFKPLKGPRDKKGQKNAKKGQKNDKNGFFDFL